jgi:hypothetical protein
VNVVELPLPAGVKCRVPDCPRDVERVRWIVLGGEPVPVSLCEPHGAEYRVDEISPAA